MHKNWGSIGRFGRTSGFSTLTEIKSMFVCGGWRKADYSKLLYKVWIKNTKNIIIIKIHRLYPF